MALYVQRQPQSDSHKMKYFVTIAEFATGIVLNPDGSRYLGAGESSLKFETADEACAYARHHFAQNPRHECLVTDSSGREIVLLRPPLAPAPLIAKPWWMFW